MCGKFSLLVDRGNCFEVACYKKMFKVVLVQINSEPTERTVAIAPPYYNKYKYTFIWFFDTNQ